MDSTLKGAVVGQADVGDVPFDDISTGRVTDAGLLPCSSQDYSEGSTRSTRSEALTSESTRWANLELLTFNRSSNLPALFVRVEHQDYFHGKRSIVPRNRHHDYTSS